MRPILFALALPLVLAACAGAPNVSGQDGPGAFVLEKTFLGHGTGTGVFRNAITGSTRPFTVVFNGRRTADGLNLKEDIAYADGEREHKLWRFTQVAPGRYEGRRDDVVGVATGVVTGNTLRLSYDVKLNTGGSKAQVHFEDALVARGGGLVENKARVSKFGVGVGTVDIAIRMGGKRG